MEIGKRLYTSPSLLSCHHLQLLLVFNSFAPALFLPSASSKFTHLMLLKCFPLAPSSLAVVLSHQPLFYSPSLLPVFLIYLNIPQIVSAEALFPCISAFLLLFFSLPVPTKHWKTQTSLLHSGNHSHGSDNAGQSTNH